MEACLNIPDSFFRGADKILDVGGWLKPEPRATHVVDLMPWETRGAKLSLDPKPDERFTKATWFQADFLKPGFRLPFAEKFFDLVICGHTVEDLAAPEALLLEMQRVAVRGVIECPSRLTEQTKGIRDRESTRPGHPHHHWIVDSVEGGLLLFSKEESDLSAETRLVPLAFTERHIASGQGKSIVIHPWVDHINYRIIRGDECRRRAQEFVSSLNLTVFVRPRDRLLRFARRMRSRIHGRSQEDFSWWPKIVETSRPYNTIESK